MPPEAMPQDYFQLPPTAHRPRAPSSSRSASSSASSLLDISRHYPQPTTDRWGGLLSTFFRAPSERSRRTTRKATRKRRILRLSNSSSSSVNSDLAYGTGYIARPKGYRSYSPRRATALAAAPGQSHPYDQRQYGGTAYPADAPDRPSLRRDKTDEEILDIGRRLSDFARKQNDHDLRAAGRSRPTGLVAAAAAAAAAAATASGSRRHKRDGTSSRGIGASRPHGTSPGDDSDWESASDDESSDGAESVLAYGSVVSQAIRPPRPAAASAIASTVSGPSMHGRQGSVVDPRLFGPVNSLRGLVTPRPFGDDESSLPAVQYRNFNRLRRVETEPIHEQAPMREVLPIPTADPTTFDAESAPPTALRRSRTSPAPVPLQQPVPVAPVPSKVYDAEKLEDASRRDWRQSRHRSEDKAFSEAAVAGVAGVAAAAVGAALVSDRRDRKDGRKEERKREDRKRDERDGQGRREDEHRSIRGLEKVDKAEKDSKSRDRESNRDKERRKSKRDSHSSSKHVDDKDQKKARRYEDERPPRKRRETVADHVSDPGVAGYRRGEIETEAEPDRYSDIPQPRHRGDRNNDEHMDRRDIRRADDAASQPAGSQDYRRSEKATVDPFRYQIDDDTLVAPKAATERPLTPTVVTVDREPDFDSWSPKSPKPELRLSRRDSFDIDHMVEDKEKGDRGRPRSDRSFDPGEQEAKEIYDEARHATVPIAVAAVASAIAIERAQSRERRRRENSNGVSPERQDGPGDAVQEQANRYYREVELARKIAGGQVRSHSQESERSVVDIWDKNDAVDEPTIVTPPDVEDREWKKDEGPYAAPDADVRIDNKIYPREVDRFRLTGSEWGVAPFKSRDPSCERERPVLNLVYPTPDSSRYPTPSPDPAKRLQEDEEQVQRSAQPEPVSDVVNEPRGEPTQPSTPKSVSWGENSTKRFEVESPEPRGHAEQSRDVAGSGERSRPLLDRSSQWGIIAAAMAGSSAEPDNEPEARDWDKASDSKLRSVAAAGPEQIFTEEPTAAPPVPGPKPVSPEPRQMPGGFADDIEFAATLAAGLKDTGFDPNIVIDDPLYHRRDSPPGESEPNGDSWNRRAASDIITNLQSHGSVAGGRPVSEPGFVIGEVETPRDEPSPASVAGEWAEVPAKLSKKERKRLEKLKRQSSEASEPATAETSGTPAFEDVADAASRRGSTKDHREHDSSASRHGDEHYPRAEAERSQSGKADPDVWEENAYGKQKKNRRSRDFDDDTKSKVSVPTDAFDDLQLLRKESVGDDWEASKKSKRKSKRSSGAHDSPTRSSVPSEVSATSSSRRSSKSKRSSGNNDDFVTPGEDPLGRSKRSPFEDHEVSSVVSDSRYDKQKRDRREGKRSSRSYDDDDDAKSVASAPGPSRKSKDSGKKSSGLFSSIFKSGGSKDEQKRESFLDNAGTSGTGVGLASIAAIATAGLVRAHATGSSSEMEHDPLEAPKDARDVEIFDPEIAPRAIKPAIDPQYGDLLPLPPSEPGSPRQTLEELPGLPDSRPGTPPDERNRKRDHETHRRWRSIQETPVKSPSSTAIPISLRLGQRGTPTPPSSGTFNSRAIMPLYLLEHSRHRSADSVPREADIPVPPSRESPAPELSAIDDDMELLDSGLGAQNLADSGLRIDTSLASAAADHDIAGSQETTPRAEQLRTANASPDVPEDLTSADEHFSDALEGHSEDAFEEALASPAQPVVLEQQVVEQPDQETVPDTTATTEAEEAEPDEWRTMTVKERKKAKMGRKNKGLDMASVAAAAATTLGAAAAAAAGVLTGESASNQDSAASQPETSRDAFEQPTKGKKGKKNRKKTLPAWEDIEETPAEPGKDESFAALQPEIPDVAADNDSSLITERETSIPTPNLDADGALAAASPDKYTEAITAPQNSDGSSAVDTTPTADQAPDPEGDCTPTIDIALRSPTAGEVLQESSEDKEIQEEVGEAVTLSEAPAPEGELQGHEGHKMTDEPGDVGQQQVLETLGQPPPSAETKRAKDEPELVLAINNAPTQEAVSDDRWSSTASSKKSKKKKKKGKAAVLEKGDAQTTEDQPALSFEDVAADQTRDKLDPVNESPEVAKEELITDEPEAVTPAPQLPDTANRDGIGATPAAIDKEETRVQETIEVTPRDEPQEPQNEPSASAEPSIVDEPREVDQSEPAIVAAAAEVAENEPVASASAVDSSTIDAEDTWATPTSSKKEKKKKRKKGQRLDASLPAENDATTVSITEETPVETAVEPEKPVDTEAQPYGETSTGESAPAALETDFAPASRGKKKKSKRKSMERELDQPSAVQETHKDDADLTIDLASKDLEATDLQPSTELETVTAAKTEDAQNSPSSSLLHDPDATAEGPVEEKVSSTPASCPLSASALVPAVSASIAASDQEPLSRKDVLEQVQKGEVVFADAPQTAKEEELAADGELHIEHTQDSTHLEPTQALEPIVSEPPFSQGEAPAEPTQDSTHVDSMKALESIVSEPHFFQGEAMEPIQDPIHLETTQADQPAPAVSAVVDETTTASASVDDFVAPKKKGKKNKRKSQGSVRDPDKDESSREHAFGPGLSTGQAVFGKVVEDATTETVDKACEAVQDAKSALVPQEVPAEGEWNETATGKKPNLSEDSKPLSTIDPAPHADLATQTTEPPVAAEEAASIEGPFLSKKGKKKKKRQSQISVTLDGDSSTPAPPVEKLKVSKASGSTVDCGTEFAVPKKGKKNKKKQHTFSWDSTSDMKPQQLTDEPAVPSEDQPAIEPETLPEVESGLTGDEASVFLDDDQSKSTRGMEQGSDTPTLETQLGSGPGFLGIGSSLEANFPGYSVADTTPADDSEAAFPVKMSKKDRKKNKKQAALNEATQPGSEEASAKFAINQDVVPEQARPESEATKETCLDRAINESRAAEEAAIGTSVIGPGASDEATTDQPVGTSEQQSEVVPDEWGGFSLKRSRKDNKKKKKAKDVEPTKPQEPETATLPGPEREQVDPPKEPELVPATDTGTLSKPLLVTPKLRKKLDRFQVVHYLRNLKRFQWSPF
ncbi:involucrin repeat protein [Hirsutella rhossiliensis]|uniref:Involucrin repeat protein n=1 Tax=Hirsutella rhossiliensis TaxID=111463 RepID=A0A9P8N5L8_9HYPO|nr:involucrin repeat protein [Hirsutella rhossiliensis]KAH0967285.1 involucrin repeat protein [Hirsutella rhossiliensis]